ncbi:hypothetical protein CHS0354_004828 [Potamilus streckersoni]|uniref:GRIP1-associated protein 1 n=1 Tax=Potamilus streckersoni TaxID=2493646 RepID=A0AAE0S8X7_9BIVA|nr:hypothetical protein CHS0354_004828 [Potamilus streckersoni]
MASSLSEEEFHRMQLQLLELRTVNYELDAKCKKQERELVGFKESYENLEKELNKAQKAINKSKKTKEVEALIQDNDSLQMKLESQEEDFRLQNQTLMHELSRLVASNEELEKQVKDRGIRQTFSETIKPAATAELDDEIRRLQAQNSALQKKLTACQEKYEKQVASLREQIHSSGKSQETSYESHQISAPETQEPKNESYSEVVETQDEENQPESDRRKPEQEKTDDLINYAQDSDVDGLRKIIEDLRLNLDTELEEKKILKNKIISSEKNYLEKESVFKEEIEKQTDKLKKKQESYVQLQEEKEQLFKDSNKKIEELQSSRERDQKYYIDQINKLQQEIDKLKKSHEDSVASRDQKIKELEAKLTTLQQHANAASIVGNEQLKEQTQKYHQQVKELQSKLLTLTQQRDDLQVQLQESQKASQEASEQLCAIQYDRDQQIQAVQEANKVAEKRKTLLDELAIKYQKDCDVHREQMLKMEHSYDAEVKMLKQKVEEEKKRSTELERLKPVVEELQAKVSSLEEKNGWLERRLNETEDSLNVTLDEKDSTISCLQTEHHEELSQIISNHAQETEYLKKSHNEEIQKCKELEESHEAVIKELTEKIKKLEQEVKDGVYAKKMHEKKGQSVLKDLKKQLHAERKRAEKLQEKLQEVLSDSKNSRGMEDLFRSPDDSYKEETGSRSSVSSWSPTVSGAGTYISMASSQQVPISPNRSKSSNCPSDLDQEHQELLNRLAMLQQEKWTLEEKVSHLETSNAAMAEDLLQKAKVIEHYVMDSRTDTRQHHSYSEEKLTLKKVLDMVSKDDQGMKDMNKKLQNMLEETLTKNMHLQKDLEVMSQELVRLSKVPVVLGSSTTNISLQDPPQQSGEPQSSAR